MCPEAHRTSHLISQVNPGSTFGSRVSYFLPPQTLPTYKGGGAFGAAAAAPAPPPSSVQTANDASFGSSALGGFGPDVQQESANMAIFDAGFGAGQATFGAQMDGPALAPKEEECEVDGAQESNTTMNLVALQHFNGAFSWGEALATTLNAKSAEEVMQMGPEGTTEKVWLTILVITFLKKTKANEKDLWELVVQKAEQFLEKEVPDKSKRTLLYRTADFIIDELV